MKDRCVIYLPFLTCHVKFYPLINMYVKGTRMLIYAGIKHDFMLNTENDRLETKLYENKKQR